MNEIEKFEGCTTDEQFFLNWRGLTPDKLRLIKNGKVCSRGGRPITETDFDRLVGEFAHRYGSGAIRGLADYLREFFRLN